MVIIYTTPTESEFFSYDPKYAHLILLKPVASIGRAKDNIPDRTCFDITDGTLNQYSEQFRSALKNASEDSENDFWSDNFVPARFSEFTFPIDTQQTLDFLGKYNFTENKSPLGYNEYYGYKCFFNYHDKQFIIWFVFKGQYSAGRNPINVNFTDSNVGKIITNSDVTVYQEFNGSILFNNHLDHDVVLTFTFIQPTPDYGKNLDDIRIPPGQTLPYDFEYYINNPTTYQYLIRPDNLQGSVTVKNPGQNCLTVEEARSLYSLVNVTLKFPQYLPDGYRYGCGIFVLTSEFISVYNNSGAPLKLPMNYAGAIDFVKKGGLLVEYDKTNSLDYYHMRSEQDAQKNNTMMSSGQYFSEIGGIPALIQHGPYFEDPSIQVSSINIYAKDHQIYVTGNFTVDELKKID